MYKSIIRPLFFRFDPEDVHNRVMRMMDWFRPLLAILSSCDDKPLSKKVMGIEFSNPVGLAAGFDKDAAHIDSFAALGFGFVEIGTVTPKSQPGNPRPRLFRLPADKGIINRMGFNNEGVEAAIENIRRHKSKVIIGGNIGKNKITPNETALDDYRACFEPLFDYVDYFVVNVSSPNTPGLRELQDKEPLTRLLGALQDHNAKRTQRKPLLLKIAPDLTDEQLQDIIGIAEETALDGIVATNTTISRDGLLTPQKRIEDIGAGGLSGAPVKKRSNEVLRFLRQNLPQNVTLIGVGGIVTPQDALDKLDAGADLLQVYSGLIYEGPFMVKRIKKALMERKAQ